MAAPNQHVIRYNEETKEILLLVHDGDEEWRMTFTNALKVTLERPEVAPILLALLGTDIKERARVETTNYFNTPESMKALKLTLKTLISEGNPGIPVTLLSNTVTHDAVGRMFDSEQGHRVLTRYFSSSQGKSVLQDALNEKSKKDRNVVIDMDDHKPAALSSGSRK